MRTWMNMPKSAALWDVWFRMDYFQEFNNLPSEPLNGPNSTAPWQRARSWMALLANTSNARMSYASCGRADQSLWPLFLMAFWPTWWGVGLALSPFSNRLTSHFIRSSARCLFFFVHASTREKTFHLLRTVKRRRRTPLQADGASEASPHKDSTTRIWSNP